MATFDEVVERIDALRDGKRRIVVGISGFGGAGKSTLARRLVEALPGSARLRGDDFLEPGLVGERSDDWSAVERRRLREEVLDPFRAGARARSGGGTGRRAGSGRTSRFPTRRCSSSTPWACSTPRSTGRSISACGSTSTSRSPRNAARHGIVAPETGTIGCGTRCGCRTIGTSPTGSIHARKRTSSTGPDVPPAGIEPATNRLEGCCSIR